MDAQCQSRYGTLKIPHWSTALSAEHDKFAALHRLWRRLHISKKFSDRMKNPKQKPQNTIDITIAGEGLQILIYNPQTLNSMDSSACHT